MNNNTNTKGQPTPLAVLQALVTRLAQIEELEGWLTAEDLDDTVAMFAPDGVQGPLLTALMDWLAPMDEWEASL